MTESVDKIGIPIYVRFDKGINVRFAYIYNE